jgi:hypothetical protein
MKTSMTYKSEHRRKRTGKTNAILILGILAIAFGTLSVFGNYVQWANAVETKAKILSSKEQWVRRGSNQVKLQVAYDVDGKSQQSEVYVMPNTIDANEDDGQIDVLYKKAKPSNVIPKAVLQDKRKTIPWIFTGGVILIAAGLFFQFRQKPQQKPDIQSSS